MRGKGIDWDAQPLGLVRDAEIARSLNVGEKAVRVARKRRGIRSGFSAKKGIDWTTLPLGADTDAAIADRIGVHFATVAKARAKLRIPRVRQSYVGQEARWLQSAQEAALARGEPPPRTLEEARRRSKRREYLRDGRKAAEKRRAIGDVGVVYLFEGDGYIKIGWTAHDPAVRLKQVQANCPIRLRVIAAIPNQTEWDEHRLHERFRALNVHGEWFRADVELLAFAKAHSANGPTTP